MNDEITQIKIGEHHIGINGLSEAIDAVRSLNLTDDLRVTQELLTRLKVQNYIPESIYDDYGKAFLREFKKAIGVSLPPEPDTSFTSIIILGFGCTACEQMERDVKSILAELDFAADVQHIRDINEIAEYGMVRTPTLLINKKIVLNGRSLPQNQLKGLIKEKLEISE
ncbi:hypothetical protein GF337_16425 [candidate division KSB1 bacterium]|nr:hypothetical protein [candidate division KSB1 bacterium]